MRKWSEKTETPRTRMVKTAGLPVSTFYHWKERYGRASEHNAPVPRDHWLEASEKKAILDFHAKYPLEGYRRLAFMMLDQDVVAVSPSSVYRVLREEYGLMPTEAEESVLADTPDAATAAALGVSGTGPVLRFTRLTFDSGGRPFEYVRSVYRGDCFTMRVRLTLTSGK